MKAFLGIAGTVFVSLLLQTGFLSGWQPRPDGVFCVTLALAFLRGPIPGALVGFCGGALEDGMSGGSLGLFSLLGICIGSACGFLSKGIDVKNFLVLFISMMLAGFFYSAVWNVVTHWITGAGHNFFPRQMFSWAILQALLGVGLFSFFKRRLFPPAIVS